MTNIGPDPESKKILNDFVHQLQHFEDRGGYIFHGIEQIDSICSWLKSSETIASALLNIPDGCNLEEVGCDYTCEYCFGENIVWRLTLPDGSYILGRPGESNG